MQKKFDDFSVQEAMRLANTDAGRQLTALFQQQQGGAFPNTGTDADIEQIKRSLAAFMKDPKAKALLRQLQEEQNGRNGR